MEKGLEIHKNIANPNLKDIINADSLARELVKESFIPACKLSK